MGQRKEGESFYANYALGFECFPFVRSPNLKAYAERFVRTIKESRWE